MNINSGKPSKYFLSFHQGIEKTQLQIIIYREVPLFCTKHFTQSFLVNKHTAQSQPTNLILAFDGLNVLEMLEEILLLPYSHSGTYS